MNCEDVELELSSEAPSEAARAHLEGCASCRETAKVLGLATLPPLSETERLLVAGLAESTTRMWSQRPAPPAKAGARFASLAVAAGLGALLASAAVLQLRPAPAPRVEQRTEFIAGTALPDFAADDAEDFNLSDDDVFFEVGWPSPTEGDL